MSGSYTIADVLEQKLFKVTNDRAAKIEEIAALRKRVNTQQAELLIHSNKNKELILSLESKSSLLASVRREVRSLKLQLEERLRWSDRVFSECDRLAHVSDAKHLSSQFREFHEWLNSKHRTVSSATSEPSEAFSGMALLNKKLSSLHAYSERIEASGKQALQKVISENCTLLEELNSTRKELGARNLEISGLKPKLGRTPS